MERSTAKDCWEKHPDKKPKPKAKSKSTNPKGKGDKDKKSGGRGKGGRKAKGRGRGKYSERCVGDQHYVCVVNPDQQNPERVRGFPVEIDVEEGENDAGENIFDDDDLDSGAVPTTPPKSDQGSDREQAPKRPRDVADERVAPGPAHGEGNESKESSTAVVATTAATSWARSKSTSSCISERNEDAAMPVPGWKSWTSRGKEPSGFKDWLEKFSGWLSLIDAYGPELWETIHADYPIRPCRFPKQVMRSKRYSTSFSNSSWAAAR